jgi:hypothetical protein
VDEGVPEEQMQNQQLLYDRGQGLQRLERSCVPIAGAFVVVVLAAAANVALDAHETLWSTHRNVPVVGCTFVDIVDHAAPPVWIHEEQILDCVSYHHNCSRLATRAHMLVRSPSASARKLKLVLSLVVVQGHCRLRHTVKVLDYCFGGWHTFEDSRTGDALLGHWVALTETAILLSTRRMVSQQNPHVHSCS